MFASVVGILGGTAFLGWAAVALLHLLDPNDGFDRIVGAVMALVWALAVVGMIASLLGF